MKQRTCLLTDRCQCIVWFWFNFVQFVSFSVLVFADQNLLERPFLLLITQFKTWPKLPQPESLINWWHWWAQMTFIQLLFRDVNFQDTPTYFMELETDSRLSQSQLVSSEVNWDCSHVVSPDCCCWHVSPLCGSRHVESQEPPRVGWVVHQVQSGLGPGGGSGAGIQTGLLSCRWDGTQRTKRGPRAARLYKGF